jgi:hypothetical protein
MRAFEPDDVMAVSTFWRQVVLETPALWSRIIMTDLPSQEHIAPRMKRFLERSKDHTLHIELSVSESSWGAWRYEDILDGLAKLLRPHIRRCVYFSLGRGFDSVTVTQLATELSPEIEYISLPEGFTPGRQNDALVGGLRVRDQQATNLRCIRGPLPYAFFLGIHFPVLKHLELTAEAPVEWEMLLNLLTNTPVLRTLIIARQELQLSAHSDLDSVVLPRLTTLRLIDWSAENLNLFFTYVSTPDLQALALLKTPAHAFPLDLVKQVKKLELPAYSTTGWTARVLRSASEVEELTMTSMTATREILEMLAKPLDGNGNGSRAWLVPKVMRMEVDCSSISGYHRVPVQELRGVLRRRRLGGVREISKLTLQGVEEYEVERLKSELDGEVELLDVSPQTKAASGANASSRTPRPWLPRSGRRSESPIIIHEPPRRPHRISYSPERLVRRRPRSRSWSPSPPRRAISRNRRGRNSPSRASLESNVVTSPLLPPASPRVPIAVVRPESRLRYATPPSPSWRIEYVPPSIRGSPVILPDLTLRGRARARSRSPINIRSRDASPPIVNPIDVSPPFRASRDPLQDWPRNGEFATHSPASAFSVLVRQEMSTIPEASSVHSSPPYQSVLIAQEGNQEAPEGVTAFGRIPSHRIYSSSLSPSPRHPSPSYSSPRRPVPLIIPPPGSPHPAFLSAQAHRTEESIQPRHHLSNRYGGRPATPLAFAPWATRHSPPPSPLPSNVPQRPSVWVEPSSIQPPPGISLPNFEPQRPRMAAVPAPWLNGPLYGHPTGGFIPNPPPVCCPRASPPPFVVQLPSRPSTRVTARVVRRTPTLPLAPPLAFGPSVPPAQHLCAGFVLQIPATQAAAPSCVMVSSDTRPPNGWV